MLQKELDSITATLCQLENQKKDAQKCLDELDEKVCLLYLGKLCFYKIVVNEHMLKHYI